MADDATIAWGVKDLRIRNDLDQPVHVRVQVLGMTTRPNRSALARRGIRRAMQGNILGSNAFNLFYATDFADRPEHQIIPALRSGFVMPTDRYLYPLIARAIVRGADAVWIKRVFDFSLKPPALRSR